MIQPAPRPSTAAPPTSPSAPGSRWLLELIALLALALGIIAIVRAWPDLPESVPIHFGLTGEPDGWSSRSTLLFLPGVAVALYLLLSAVQRVPGSWYNFPVPLTDDNRAVQVHLARELVLVLKAVTLGLFAHLIVASLQVSLGHADGLGPWIWLWVAGVFGLIGVYLFRALRAH